MKRRVEEIIDEIKDLSVRRSIVFRHIAELEEQEAEINSRIDDLVDEIKRLESQTENNS